MIIYMDACCYNRPMDDQSQDRIYIESETILSILMKCEKGLLTLVGSDVLIYELNNTTDDIKKQKSLALLTGYESEHYSLTDEIKERANILKQYGIKAYDSLHLATAEYAEAEYLLTVDDKLINLSGKTDTKVKVINPVKLIMEAIKDE